LGLGFVPAQVESNWLLSVGAEDDVVHRWCTRESTAVGAARREAVAGGIGEACRHPHSPRTRNRKGGARHAHDEAAGRPVDDERSTEGADRLSGPLAVYQRRVSTIAEQEAADARRAHASTR